MVIVGTDAAGTAALAESDGLVALVAFVALVADDPKILALLAAAPTGGPMTITAEGALLGEVVKGALL